MNWNYLYILASIFTTTGIQATPQQFVKFAELLKESDFFNEPVDANTLERAARNNADIVRAMVLDRKIEAIKLLRNLTQCSLKDAKDTIESLIPTYKNLL